MTRNEYDALGADALDQAFDAEYRAEHETPHRDVESYRQLAATMHKVAEFWWQRAAEAS